MADQLLLPPAEDGNGDRVSAAVAYFYQTGTTTPVTVYEEDGTTPLGTSVVADANGVFAQVFTTSGTGIKIDVKTPLGASLPGYPFDPAVRVATSNSQAAQVSFAPTLDIPETNVQAAIEATLPLSLTTTFTRTILDDTSAASVRATIGAPTLPQSASGNGQWTRVQSATAGATCTLPAGGTWAYFMIVTDPSGSVIAYNASVAAGGALIYGSTVSDNANAFCWRIA